MQRASLNLLIDAAIAARDNAARVLAERQRQQQLAQRHLDTLRGYSSDYATRGADQRVRGLDIAAEFTRRAFVGRLDDAVATQRRDVERCERETDAAAAALRAAALKSQRLQALAARQDERARLTADRREQKHNDEMAGATFRAHVADPRRSGRRTATAS